MNRLVILAPNWLGDAVMALPAMADVRRALPGRSIAVAARPAIAPLYTMIPEVNDTIVLERRSPRGMSAWRELGAELRGREFDAAIVLPNSFQAALIVARAAVPERWGYRTDWRGPLLTRAVYPPSVVHQAEYYQYLVHALEFPNGPMEYRLGVTSEIRAVGGHALEAAGWDRRSPLVALAPGAAYGGAKRWPPESFAELARALASDGVATVLVGSAADGAGGLEIEAASGGATSILNLIGRTDLPTLAGVLVNCRALVSNDSGAMHLAGALGVSVTAIFGPSDERATAPLGMVRLKPDTTETVRLKPDATDVRHTLLTHPVWCRPCLLRECPLDHRCMRGVAVGAVLEAARRSL